MPRRLRVQPVGFPLHVIKRGNNRQACFCAEEDYQFFLHHLGELAMRFKCEVHAHALMTNHFHLLLTPRMGRGASLLMKLLGQRYVQYVNKTYRRCGTLWDGRFRSSLVQGSRYVLACYRYIEMNGESETGKHRHRCVLPAPCGMRGDGQRRRVEQRGLVPEPGERGSVPVNTTREIGRAGGRESERRKTPGMV